MRTHRFFIFRGSKLLRYLDLRSSIPVVTLVLCMTTGQLLAQCLVPANHHPWGRFNVGSWKKVRVITVDFDEKGEVFNTTQTETTTKLTRVDATSYTLAITVNVWVAGKEISEETKTVRKGYGGENIGDTVKLETVGKGEVKVGGVTIPTEIRRLVVESGGQQRTTTIHYSKTVSPFVLRRDTKSVAPETMKTTFASHGEVIVAEIPLPFMSEILPSSIVRTVHRRPDGQTINTEVHSLDVPGGVVAHKSNETDKSGRMVRSSQLELVDFHAEKPSPAPSRLRRIRERIRQMRGIR